SRVTLKFTDASGNASKKWRPAYHSPAMPASTHKISARFSEPPSWSLPTCASACAIDKSTKPCHRKRTPNAHHCFIRPPNHASNPVTTLLFLTNSAFLRADDIKRTCPKVQKLTCACSKESARNAPNCSETVASILS